MPDEHLSLPDHLIHALEQLLGRSTEQQEAGLLELCDAHAGEAAALRQWFADVRTANAAIAGNPTPTRIGSYRVLEQIAQGGMGIVYAAEQQQPVRRRVAVKVIKPGMDSREVLARFEAERQALALMNHAHIAKVLEAGTTATGQPFFAMEFVAGPPITTFADKNRLTMRERLDLFVQVCDGVQHAHQKGVIHRDLKPSNILVTHDGGKPFAKIIDFGVAKAIQQPLTEKTIYTHQGQLIGTPEYMSPEQAEMTGVAVDTRSDIYALGVMLYELLTGSLPFDPHQFRSAGFQGMIKILREQEPQKPSTKVTTTGAGASELAHLRRTEIGSLKRSLRGDLDWVTIKALEKDPGRRYQSAGEFAADIARHLRNEPVVAGPPTFFYRLTKAMRRHRGPIAAATAVLFALVAGLIASLWLYFERDRALSSERQALKLARVKEQAAVAAEAETERKRQAMVALFAELSQLKTDSRVAGLKAEVDRLWPIRPAMISKFEQWLNEAERLARERVARAATGDRQLNPVLDRVAIDVESQLIARVRARLERARLVQRETIEAHAASWSAASRYAARDPRYHGIVLKPQLGLIPLGPDPDSRLLEFAHYGSGTPVRRGSSGSLDPVSGFGIVFVLLPAAVQTAIGSQTQNPEEPNYDRDSQPNEAPVRFVDIPGFLISKFELTQSQWCLLAEAETPATSSARTIRSSPSMARRQYASWAGTGCSCRTKRNGSSRVAPARRRHGGQATRRRRFVDLPWRRTSQMPPSSPAAARKGSSTSGKNTTMEWGRMVASGRCAPMLSVCTTFMGTSSSSADRCRGPMPPRTVWSRAAAPGTDPLLSRVRRGVRSCPPLGHALPTWGCARSCGSIRSNEPVVQILDLACPPAEDLAFVRWSGDYFECWSCPGHRRHEPSCFSSRVAGRMRRRSRRLASVPAAVVGPRGPLLTSDRVRCPAARSSDVWRIG